MAITDNKKRLLITGGSGFLGYHLLASASTQWEVCAIHHQHQPRYNTCISLLCDVTNYIELGNLLEDIEPDAVIHTAALTDVNYCQNNPQESYSVNVEASRNLAGLCSDLNIPFAFTSTDLVFDGQKGNYTEEDTPNPLMRYGEHKVMAEEEVLRIYPRATVFRLPVMFGYKAASEKNYLQQLIKNLNAGLPQKLFTDEYRSVCGAKSIAKGLLQLFENTNGIYHLAGTEKFSRYEFALLAAELYDLNKSLILPCLQADVRMAAPRPADVSLNISKAVAIGYQPLLITDELTLIKDNE
ncbi:MAG: NAD(P)-dependent oxidoreductase [Chitinophagales bacterium]|nr:NAD(P)-dependent oxidoreductase [Chitinophagales bacterium]